MRIIGFAIFATGGLALLLGLGIWQVQRLAWKTAILDRIETRIADTPVALPDAPTEERDEYLPVTVSGRTTGDEIHVLTTSEAFGPSYRVVSAFETDASRRILVDLGAIPTAQKDAPRPPTDLDVTGNLLWPDEVDGFTPAPDMAANIWFARDLPAMAQALDSEPLLVVARAQALPGVLPLPVGTTAIPNDHLQYAITWFSLAAIWAGMTVLLLSRMARRQT
ncbi:SURF1 family protein [Maribius pontilimi]|uniref:SURF1-like protein n=1 Tax=Palleronia pontilimi TaxID=1964209 RepID=A0A934IE78_9RHOB|nr:SURF1 family protein [Palleronia pontilimi]MBJ3761233.1 SURF1 family protein [Palleronia pontilimi]